MSACVRGAARGWPQRLASPAAPVPVIPFWHESRKKKCARLLALWLFAIICFLAEPFGGAHKSMRRTCLLFCLGTLAAVLADPRCKPSIQIWKEDLRCQPSCKVSDALKEM